MSVERLFEVILVFMALSCFTVVYSFTVPPGRTLEPLLLGIVLISCVVLSCMKKPFLKWDKKRYIWADSLLIGLAVLKDWQFPYSININSFFNFSLIFSIGEAFCVLSVLELCRTTSAKTRLTTFSFLVIITASHSQSPYILVPFIIIYSIFLVLFSRAQTLGTQKHSTKGLAFVCMVIFIFMVLSSVVPFILFQYRSELNSLRLIFFHSKEKKKISGFSQLTTLDSKKINISRKTVIRYFASQSIYHLRGDVCDTYGRGIWGLSDKEVTSIQGKQDQDTMLFDISSTSASEKKWNELILIQPSSLIFTPPNPHAISMSYQNDIFTNNEEIYWVSGSLPSSISIMVSEKEYSPLRKLSRKDYRRYTQMPEELTNYFKLRSQDIVGSLNTTDIKKVALIKNYLIEHNKYRLEFATEVNRDPIEYFITTGCAGHCEMFASAFIMLVRAQGIPARFVSGYYAHEWNSLGEFITVRECDAHAWAEVYIDGKGWITVDPTPSGPLQHDQYRGVAETTREYISEWFRKLNDRLGHVAKYLGWKLTYLLIASCFLTMIFLLIKLIRLFKFIRKRKQQAKKALQPFHSLRLHKLFVSFYNTMVKNVRKRDRCETIREYISSLNDHIYPELRGFSEALLLQVENDLYGESPPSDDILEELEKEWQKINL